MSGRQLSQVLGKWFAVAACVGGTIGLGILRTPGEVASAAGSPAIYLLLWVFGAGFSLLSLSVSLELVAMTSRSGGPYVLVDRAFGPLAGFIVGWSDWIAACATRALMAVVAIEYASQLYPPIAPYTLVASLGLTTFFAALQFRGARTGGFVHQAASISVAFIILVFAVMLIIGAAASGQLGFAHAGGEAIQTADLKVFALAIAAIVFTYDGWLAASYFTGEIKGGVADNVRGSIMGIVAVIFIYLAINLALTLSVPLNILQGHDLALSAGVEASVGAGALVYAAAVLILFGSQNFGYMIAARTLHALSTDGLAHAGATRVSAKGTPTVAVAVTWLTIVSQIVIGGYEFLLSLVSMLFMLAYIAVIAGVMRLRKSEPATVRQYQTPWLRFTGPAALAGWMALTVLVAWAEPASAIYGVLFVAASVPVFYWLKTRKTAAAAAG